DAAVVVARDLDAAALGESDVDVVIERLQRQAGRRAGRGTDQSRVAPGCAAVGGAAEVDLGVVEHDGDVGDAGRAAGDRHLADGDRPVGQVGREVVRGGVGLAAVGADDDVGGRAAFHDRVDRAARVERDLASGVGNRGGAGQIGADLDRRDGLERLDVAAG